MDRKEYSDYLTSTEWLMKKVELVEEYKRRGEAICCDICGFTDNLQAHHLTYKSEGMPELMRFYCKDCHRDFHKLPGFARAIWLQLRAELTKKLTKGKLFRNAEEAQEFIEKKIKKLEGQ